MYEAISKVVGPRDSRSEERFEVRTSIGNLRVYAGEGFIECEAIVSGNNGHGIESICRMRYEEAIILSELPSENSTPVPFNILFDDVAIAMVKGIPGGMVRTENGRVYRTDLAERATYILRKEFKDVRAEVLQNYSADITSITGTPVPAVGARNIE